MQLQKFQQHTSDGLAVIKSLENEKLNNENSTDK